MSDWDDKIDRIANAAKEALNHAAGLSDFLGAGVSDLLGAGFPQQDHGERVPQRVLDEIATLTAKNASLQRAIDGQLEEFINGKNTELTAITGERNALKELLAARDEQIAALKDAGRDKPQGSGASSGMWPWP